MRKGALVGASIKKVSYPGVPGANVHYDKGEPWRDRERDCISRRLDKREDTSKKAKA